ncbi:ABC transporter ATP-binding protein [Candidatus Poriferisocius sp.]|uniref:ABC transporter ATP-binding protein n=1 Tax=Candidatus Poriferisocius sp. TaxID=3101276 RepID=UPI003B029D4A
MSRSVMDTEQTLSPHREDCSQNITGDLAISCADVSLAFGEQHVLDGLCWEVTKGSRVAVMGPSGSGKTSLLHILAGIIIPYSGRVSIAGLDLQRARTKARAVLRQRKVSMVFQFGELLPELRVGENVALPLLLRGDKPSVDLVNGVLEAVGFDNPKAWPAQLSGGETQRVAIARALVTQPEVILCDEPTGSLDKESSKLVVSVLRGAASDSGATLVVCTHDQSVADQMGEVYDLTQGRLAHRQ